MDQERELELVNEFLETLYGKSMSGKVRFRVVFSDGETEKRKGDYDIYSSEGILLRTEMDSVRHVLKYPMQRERFILERYSLEPYGTWPSSPPPREVFDYNGYEPFYVFSWVQARPVPPIEAVYFIIQTNIFKEVPGLAQIWDAKENERKKLLEKSMDILDEISPYLVGQLLDGEAVVVPDMKGSE